MISFNQIHDEITRIVDALTQGGGGGSTVSVVSKRNTGENIADITVNNTTTQLYAPDSASDISFDPTVKGVYSGTNTQSVVDEITDDISSLNDTISNINKSTLIYNETSLNVSKTVDVSQYRTLFVSWVYTDGRSLVSQNVPVDVLPSLNGISLRTTWASAEKGANVITSVSGNNLTLYLDANNLNIPVKVYGLK